MSTFELDERARRAGLSTETLAGFEGDQGDQALIDRIIRDLATTPNTEHP